MAMRNESVVILALLLGGCLLPTPPAAPRYFTPGTAASDAPRAPVAVRITSVRSPLHLREPMTWRRSEVEYGFYDQRRWTELPATYVERALARELLGDERGSVAVAPVAPVLTAELRAFEEVLSPVHEVRVAVEVEVADGGCVRLHRTFAASRPLDGTDGVTVARGIGEALDEVARTTGDAVRQTLATRRRCGA